MMDRPGDEEGWFRGRGLDRVVPRLGLSTFLTRRSGGLRSFRNLAGAASADAEGEAADRISEWKE